MKRSGSARLFDLERKTLLGFRVGEIGKLRAKRARRFGASIRSIVEHHRIPFERKTLRDRSADARGLRRSRSQRGEVAQPQLLQYLLLYRSCSFLFSPDLERAHILVELLARSHAHTIDLFRDALHHREEHPTIADLDEFVLALVDEIVHALFEEHRRDDLTRKALGGLAHHKRCSIGIADERDLRFVEHRCIAARK